MGIDERKAAEILIMTQEDIDRDRDYRRKLNKIVAKQWYASGYISANTWELIKKRYCGYA